MTDYVIAGMVAAAFIAGLTLLLLIQHTKRKAETKGRGCDHPELQCVRCGRRFHQGY